MYIYTRILKNMKLINKCDIFFKNIYSDFIESVKKEGKSFVLGV